MRWRLEFYHERRGRLARYDVEATRPAEAIALGWKAVVAEHDPAARCGRPSLFERARRVGGQDASGWVLYRVVNEDGAGSPAVAPAPAVAAP